MIRVNVSFNLCVDIVPAISLIDQLLLTVFFRRQQKRVSEENLVFFHILQKALPPPPPDEAEDPLIDEGTTGEAGSVLSNHIIGNGIDTTSGKK